MLLGIETGGTKVVCASATSPLDLVEVQTFATTAPDETLGRIAAFVAEQQKRGPVEAVGIGAFGPIDLDPTSPSYATLGATPKPGWQGTRLLDAVRAATDAPVVIDTDVTAAALAEQRWGAGAGLADLTYVTVGTGIGVGALVEGRRLHGTAHPEIGHLTVRRHPDDTFAGVCRLHGACLEGLASGPAITARWGRPADDLADRRHEAVAVESHYLAQLVAALTYLLSPARIVLGGGVMHMPELLDALRAQSARLVAGALGDDHQVSKPASGYLVTPALGGNAGVVGALTLAAELVAGHR
ncbi:MAG: ROK family protein [Jiangellales bacterium]